MDAIVIVMPQGNAYVQPQHIVGVIPQDENSCIIVAVGGLKFLYQGSSDSVWEWISNQLQSINMKKNQQVATLLSVLTEPKAKKGGLN